MVCQISPSPLIHIFDPWANRVGGPETNQDVVEVLPFVINHLLNRLLEAAGRVDVDMSNGLGFDRLENGGNPLDT